MDYEGYEYLELTVYCTVLERAVPPDIVERGKFEDPRRLSLYDMSQIAQLIDTREGVDRGSYL